MTDGELVVAVGERRYRGRAIDLRRHAPDVPAGAVATALERSLAGKDASDGRDGDGADDDHGTGDDRTGDEPLRVWFPGTAPTWTPRPLFVTGSIDLDLRTWLAAAARSRGFEPPQAPTLRAARRALAACERPTVDTQSARRRLASAGSDVAELRERVATLRGRVETLRDLDRTEEAAAVREDLAAAAAALSEAETERTAARQRLERLEARAREARDARERRLRLEDRVANLERSARASLAARVYDEFADAVRRLPGEATPGDGPAEFEGSAATAALASVAVADAASPVVSAAGAFGSAGEAAARLDAAVVLARARI